MTERLSLGLAAVRLAVVAGVVALVGPKVAEAGDKQGGCSSNVTHGCARPEGVFDDLACTQGTSGGCEDCVDASKNDWCFYGSGPMKEYYKPAKEPE